MNRGLLCLSLLLVATSCGYPTKGAANHPGIYECRGPGPTYQLDTESIETVYFIGSTKALQFRDLISGRVITLDKDSDYSCERIQQ